MDQTDALIQPFETLQEQIIQVIDSLTEEQWRWSPTPKDWPVALTIDHINAVNGLVVPRLEEAIRQGRANNQTAPGPFRYPLFDRLFVFALEPRAPLKQQAPAIYRPENAPALPQVRERFLYLQSCVINAVRDSLGLDLVHIKIASPVNARLQFSLGTWFDALKAHEQNHYEQAARMAEAARMADAARKTKNPRAG